MKRLEFTMRTTMKVQHLHEWNVSPDEAKAIQLELAKNLIDEPIDIANIKTIAGVDVSVKNDISQAAVVVTTYPDMQAIELVRAQRPTSFPYIPGLLTFREGEVLVDAFEKLNIIPDVFVFDGMGRIHPRKLGIAAHMGLWLDKPTIGCGKTHLLGNYDAPAETRGSYSELRYKKELLGVVLRTRDKVKPVYISHGNRATLETAIQVIMAVTTKYRLPQPIRLAHNAAGQYESNE
jgi:deoxyribonuclease V